MPLTHRRVQLLLPLTVQLAITAVAVRSRLILRVLHPQLQQRQLSVTPQLLVDVGIVQTRPCARRARRRKQPCPGDHAPTLPCERIAPRPTPSLRRRATRERALAPGGPTNGSSLSWHPARAPRTPRDSRAGLRRGYRPHDGQFYGDDADVLHHDGFRGFVTGRRKRAPGSASTALPRRPRTDSSLRAYRPPGPPSLRRRATRERALALRGTADGDTSVIAEVPPDAVVVDNEEKFIDFQKANRQFNRAQESVRAAKERLYLAEGEYSRKGRTSSRRDGSGQAVADGADPAQVAEKRNSSGMFVTPSHSARKSSKARTERMRSRPPSTN